MGLKIYIFFSRYLSCEYVIVKYWLGSTYFYVYEPSTEMSEWLTLINYCLLFSGFWHPARGICMNLQKQWKCFNGGSEVRCMTNDSVINDTSLKTIVDSENFVAIILDDLKWSHFFYKNTLLIFTKKHFSARTSSLYPHFYIQLRDLAIKHLKYWYQFSSILERTKNSIKTNSTSFERSKSGLLKSWRFGAWHSYWPATPIFLW